MPFTFMPYSAFVDHIRHLGELFLPVPRERFADFIRVASAPHCVSVPYDDLPQDVQSTLAGIRDGGWTWAAIAAELEHPGQGVAHLVRRR